MKYNVDLLFNNIVHSSILCILIQWLVLSNEGNVFSVWIGWTIGLLISWFLLGYLESKYND